MAALAGAGAAQEASFDSKNGSGPGALIQKARASANDGIPEIVGAPLPPAGIPENGHNIEFAPALYNIWSVNCHTEANFFTALASARGIPAGILACQGDPESSPGFHTASWAVAEKGETCIYNYGERCCWDASASSPDIASVRGRQCAQWACGDQYHPDQTRALPAGRLVESPGPHVCAVGAAGGPLTLLPGMAIIALSERLRTGAETIRVPPYPSHPEGAVLTFTSDRLEACLECCGARADLWSGLPEASSTPKLAKARERDFRRLCQRTCRNSFKQVP